MNNRTNQRQVGRLTGRVEVDAGLLTYRNLLNREHTVVAGSSRRAARVAMAVLLLVLAFSVASVAVECAGCLYLSPGTSGGGSLVHSTVRAPEVALTDGEGAVAVMSAGTVEFAVAGRFYLEEPAQYAGELVVGPYEFAP